MGKLNNFNNFVDKNLALKADITYEVKDGKIE